MLTCSGDGDKTEFSNCNSLGKFLAATCELPPATRILSGTCILRDAACSLSFMLPLAISFIPFCPSPAPISCPPTAIRSGTYFHTRKDKNKRVLFLEKNIYIPDSAENSAVE